MIRRTPLRRRWRRPSGVLVVLAALPLLFAQGCCLSGQNCTPDFASIHNATDEPILIIQIRDDGSQTVFATVEPGIPRLVGGASLRRDTGCTPARMEARTSEGGRLLAAIPRLCENQDWTIQTDGRSTLTDG